MSIWKRLFGGEKPNPPSTTPESHPTSKSPLPVFPFELIEVAGKDALNTCLKLREQNPRTFTPVILGSRDELSLIEDNFEINETPLAQILETSTRVVPDEFFADRKADYENIDMGEWPVERAPIDGISADKNTLSGRFHESVVIAKVPTAHSYEVPAYLRLGGWNECPGPEEHVAILRRWHSLYGAEVVCVTKDVIECTVVRPPTSKEAAMKLAEEQFLYCTDIVDQGVGSISNLGASLVNAKFWYFWWD